VFARPVFTRLVFGSNRNVASEAATVTTGADVAV
jgi:hypothetical protein